ncbi:MAG TPA: RNA polymerase sigma factor [Elusimicrobiales bacterium]|nr:RNA polymerase sigma factor [Elusimicrobiales bacterium]
MADINRLIETHSGKAYLAAYRLTGNQADACDLVQETFVRVIRKAELYDEAFDFGGWLQRMLFRVYLNGRRAQGRRREVPLETPEGECCPLRAAEAAAGESPEKISEAAELREKLSSALNALPPELRACVVLVDVEGHDYGQAAEILGWPVGSVSGRLFRARRLLRDMLRRVEGI